MTGSRWNGWWALLAIAVLLLLFGVGDMANGVANDPGIPLGVTGMTPAELEAEGPNAYRMYDLTVRSQGSSLVMVGGLMSAILLFAFRRGRRWAWWTMWLLPAWAVSISVAGMLIGVAPGQQPPPPVVSGFVLGLLAGAILLVSAPRFFGDRGAKADGSGPPAITA
jgi:hypothetical protein